MQAPPTDGIGAAVPPASLRADARLDDGSGVASVVLPLTDMALIAVWLANCLLFAWQDRAQRTGQAN
ncbi:hypothetical protein KQH60_06025 [Mycetohabitans sp. B8]|uniref:hypothetical protein n=1 Tax=Mycetohabitans sp. B8 TaxID=2841845 RepID=UPI001F476FD8|nr:hypothetical protein [Mycetohabitans sp. B8]MCG1042136.1 hypothetical protein [Mycetohabitans sp. B8]